MRRGRESHEHRELKQSLGELLKRRNCVIAYEECQADVIAWDPIDNQITAFEIERSARNTTRNIVRNWSAGCDLVVLVQSGSCTRRSLESAIPSRAPTKGNYVQIITPDSLFDVLEHGSASQGVRALIFGKCK